jgi:hypothetical protein
MLDVQQNDAYRLMVLKNYKYGYSKLSRNFGIIHRQNERSQTHSFSAQFVLLVIIKNSWLMKDQSENNCDGEW